MIHSVLATVLTVVQVPAEAVLPEALEERAIDVTLQATDTHFVAENNSNGSALLFFGNEEFGHVSIQRLNAGEAMIIPFARGTADELSVEVVTFDGENWSNTGALSLEAIRMAEQHALWIEVVSGHAIGWMESGRELQHAVPTTGLLPKAFVRSTSGLHDYSDPTLSAPAATHVPAITPAGDKRGNTPPVIDEKPLPPV